MWASNNSVCHPWAAQSTRQAVRIRELGGSTSLINWEPQRIFSTTVMSLMRDVSQAHPRYSDLPGWADLIETTEQYAVPRWYFATYFLLILYTVCAADNGVKCSTWKRLRIQLTARHAVQMHNKPQPPFRSRFFIGLCGVLTVLIAIGMSVAVAHSLFGDGSSLRRIALPYDFQ